MNEHCIFNNYILFNRELISIKKRIHKKREKIF